MKILVPLDGSQFAEAVLEPLAGFAGSNEAELQLVEVVKESDARATLAEPTSSEHHLAAERGMPSALGGSIPEFEPRIPAESRAQAQDRLRQEADDYLAHVNERFFGGLARTEVIWGEDAAEAIINYAANQKVDLIAIATHGRTGLARMMMGSVAGALLRARVTPIYMVRPEGLGE